MKKVRYLIEPPKFLGFKAYDFPFFLIPRSKGINVYLRQLCKWAHSEYYGAIAHFAAAGNLSAIAKIRSISPAHILSQLEVFDMLIERLSKDDDMWRSLDDETQEFVLEANDIRIKRQREIRRQENQSRVVFSINRKYTELKHLVENRDGNFVLEYR